MKIVRNKNTLKGPSEFKEEIMAKVKRVEKLENHSFMFTCLDGEKTPPLRAEHLFGHLDHIEANNEKYRIAGPMYSSPEGESVGSFFNVEANSEKEAWEIMNGDPYMKSDMYETVTVNYFIPACGKLLGGITWEQEEIRANIKKYT